MRNEGHVAVHITGVLGVRLVRFMMTLSTASGMEYKIEHQYRYMFLFSRFNSCIQLIPCHKSTRGCCVDLYRRNQDEFRVMLHVCSVNGITDEPSS